MELVSYVEEMHWFQIAFRVIRKILLEHKMLVIEVTEQIKQTSYVQCNFFNFLAIFEIIKKAVRRRQNYWALLACVNCFGLLK
jgi:hypothetical protein